MDLPHKDDCHGTLTGSKFSTQVKDSKSMKREEPSGVCQPCMYHALELGRAKKRQDLLQNNTVAVLKIVKPRVVRLAPSRERDAPRLRHRGV